MREPTSWWDIVVNCELGSSSAIFDAGYEIDCLESTHHGLPFHLAHKKSSITLKELLAIDSFNKKKRSLNPTHKCPSDICHSGFALFFTSIHPLEVVFIKANRNIDPDMLKKFMFMENFKMTIGAQIGQ